MATTRLVTGRGCTRPWWAMGYGRRVRPAFRVGVAAAGLLAAAAAGARYAELRGERAALAASVRPLATQPATLGVLAGLGSEPSLAAARARLARALVAEVLRPGARAPAEHAADLARLRLANGLALRALAQEPASWEALLALGASTYLEWSLAEDNRLFIEARAWERPLRRAQELAPWRAEPARFLSLAYLELWRVLPDWKREQARKLVAQGLADPATFDRLIEPWLEVSSHEGPDAVEQALALVPPAPFAWQRLHRLFAARGDWPALARAATRLEAALAADLGRQVAAAEARLAAGEPAAAREMLLAALGQMPVDGRYATLFSRALQQLPAGSLDSASVPALEAWLDWALQLCAERECPLPPAVLGRLARGCEPREQPLAALALLASGDRAGAERLERQAGGTSQPGWAPYWIAKARQLAGGRDAEGARAALALLPGWAERGPAYWTARLAVARASSDAAARAEAETQLAFLAAERVPASAWRSQGASWAMELYVAGTTSALRVALAPVPPAGAAVLARIDGTSAGTFALAPAATELLIPAPLAPGSHRFELEALANTRVEPREVVVDL